MRILLQVDRFSSYFQRFVRDLNFLVFSAERPCSIEDDWLLDEAKTMIRLLPIC